MIISPWWLLLVPLLCISVKSGIYSYDTSRGDFGRNINTGIVPCFIVFIILVLVSAYSVYNDAGIYIANFNNLPDELLWKNITSRSWGENPGFYLFQVALKDFVSTDAFVFKFVSAIIIQFGILEFYRTYSCNLSLTLFIHIVLGLYMFTIPAMKQSMAISIGLLAFTDLVNKRWLAAGLILLLAATIHPYIVMFLVIPFLNGDVWSKREMLILGTAVLLGFMFEKFVSVAINTTQSITGDSYELETFTESAGSNILRVLVYAIVPIMSYIYRNKINTQVGIYTKRCISLSVIPLAFYVIGTFGGANFFGRLANYFAPFEFVAFTYILSNIVPVRSRAVVKILAIIFLIVFYYFLVRKSFA